MTFRVPDTRTEAKIRLLKMKTPSGKEHYIDLRHMRGCSANDNSLVYADSFHPSPLQVFGSKLFTTSLFTGGMGVIAAGLVVGLRTVAARKANAEVARLSASAVRLRNQTFDIAVTVRGALSLGM
jgi:hypothetical protein